jgi:hypothetical protein
MFIAPSTDQLATPSSSPTKVEEDKEVPVKVAQEAISRGRGNTTTRGERRPLDASRVTVGRDYDCRGTPLVMIVLFILTGFIGVQIVREQGTTQLQF